jgi:hypothetical protein
VTDRPSNVFVRQRFTLSELNEQALKGRFRSSYRTAVVLTPYRP